jgi:hypothetical protein
MAVNLVSDTIDKLVCDNFLKVNVKPLMRTAGEACTGKEGTLCQNLNMALENLSIQNKQGKKESLCELKPNRVNAMLYS